MICDMICDMLFVFVREGLHELGVKGCDILEAKKTHVLFLCKMGDELDEKKKRRHRGVIKKYIYFQCLLREGVYTDETLTFSKTYGHMHFQRPCLFISIYLQVIPGMPAAMH